MNVVFIRRTDRNISFLLVLLVLSMLCSPMSIPTSAKEESVPINYRIRLHMIRDDIALHIRSGDSIVDAVGKHNIGKISDIRYEKCLSEVFSHKENRNVISEYEGFCDISLTVSANAVRTERGYSVDGYYLRLGKDIPLRLPDFYGVGKCVSVTFPEGYLYEADGN